VKIFIAGASGAIGEPLIAELVRQGHTVTGMTRSEAGMQKLISLGATGVQVSAFDAVAVEKALQQSKAEVVIDQLTALSKLPSELAKALAGDRKLRLEGGQNLYRAAQASGVRRYIQQSSGFYLKAGQGLADESERLAIDASGNVAASAQMYTSLESRVLDSPTVEGLVLRYGFFYGPNTWYHPKGGAAEQVQQQQFPIVGAGEGVWSFVQVEDAALATIAALTAPPGIYNVVDDDPTPVSRWLPDFARWVGGPPPPRITEQQAREAAGEDPVYYGTKLRGASNEKARKILGFRPRRLQWLLL
jgi:nucleoside-diphosphate-sugar epimerase